jgi:hypothetical protein
MYQWATPHLIMSEIMENNDIKLFDLLLHIPNYLSKRDCESLIKYYNKVESEQLSYYEHSTTPEGEDKSSSFRCIEITDPTVVEFSLLRFAVVDLAKRYRAYLESFNSFHMHNIRTGAFNYVHKWRLLKYSEGSSIHQHSDHAPFGYGSCTINLNEDYEGGEFTFFNGKKQIKLKQGDAIVFPADHYWVHEVKKIISGERYSFNCFLNKIPVDIMMSLNDLAAHWSCLTHHPCYVGDSLIIVSEDELLDRMQTETQNSTDNNNPNPK